MSNTSALPRLLAPALACALAATVMTGMVTSAAGRARTYPHAAPASTANRSHSVDVRVASFNIQSATVDRNSGWQRPWKRRRTRVVAQILDRGVDVIGIQEAAYTPSFARRMVRGRTQYIDLLKGLNRAGGHYALTSRAAVNCAKPFVAYHCHRRDRNASAAERIIYNTRTLSLVRRNARKYARQSSSSPNMHLAWAVLRSRATGARFLFTTTHLSPVNRRVRQAQWWQMISTIKRIRNGMPVVSVGDFNTHKMDPMARTMLPAMRRAHIGDVLNQQYRVNPSRHVRARTRVHAWLNTYNHLTRNVRSFGYENRRRKTGNGIDYIFASNRLSVRRYEVVCSFRRLRVRGVMPSDHNMIRATIRIP